MEDLRVRFNEIIQASEDAARIQAATIERLKARVLELEAELARLEHERGGRGVRVGNNLT